MKSFNRYLVKSTDKFNPETFSSLNEEIAAINVQTGHLPIAFKPEIIVSFAKDHSLQNEWITANPGLVALVTSGSLFSGSMEALFDSSRKNLAFRHDLEVYLRTKFTELLTHNAEIV